MLHRLFCRYVQQKTNSPVDMRVVMEMPILQKKCIIKLVELIRWRAFTREPFWRASWDKGNGSLMFTRRTSSWPTRWSRAGWLGECFACFGLPLFQQLLVCFWLLLRLFQAGTHLGEDAQLSEWRVRGGASVWGEERGVPSYRRPQDLLHYQSPQIGNLLLI